jgi:hypothetical protein
VENVVAGLGVSPLPKRPKRRARQSPLRPSAEADADADAATGDADCAADPDARADAPDADADADVTSETAESGGGSADMGGDKRDGAWNAAKLQVGKTQVLVANKRRKLSQEGGEGAESGAGDTVSDDVAPPSAVEEPSSTAEDVSGTGKGIPEADTLLVLRQETGEAPVTHPAVPTSLEASESIRAANSGQVGAPEAAEPDEASGKDNEPSSLAGVPSVSAAGSPPADAGADVAADADAGAVSPAPARAASPPVDPPPWAGTPALPPVGARQTCGELVRLRKSEEPIVDVGEWWAPCAEPDQAMPCHKLDSGCTPSKAVGESNQAMPGDADTLASTAEPGGPATGSDHSMLCEGDVLAPAPDAAAPAAGKETPASGGACGVEDIVMPSDGHATPAGRGNDVSDVDMTPSSGAPDASSGDENDSDVPLIRWGRKRRKKTPAAQDVSSGDDSDIIDVTPPHFDTPTGGRQAARDAAFRDENDDLNVPVTPMGGAEAGEGDLEGICQDNVFLPGVRIEYTEKERNTKEGKDKAKAGKEAATSQKWMVGRVHPRNAAKKGYIAVCHGAKVRDEVNPSLHFL